MHDNLKYGIECSQQFPHPSATHESRCLWEGRVPRPRQGCWAETPFPRCLSGFRHRFGIPLALRNTLSGGIPIVLPLRRILVKNTIGKQSSPPPPINPRCPSFPRSLVSFYRVSSAVLFGAPPWPRPLLPGQQVL